jgi:hypothetical protein
MEDGLVSCRRPDKSLYPHADEKYGSYRWKMMKTTKHALLGSGLPAFDSEVMLTQSRHTSVPTTHPE